MTTPVVPAPTFQAIGECMVEIVRTPGGSALIGYAGDTYNTAVYFRRVAAELGIDVAPQFLSALGDDDESDLMRARWHADGVVADTIVVPGSSPGLYVITTDLGGERSFSYWRENSAAARMFAGSEWIERVSGSIVYLSGISLQLMSSESRTALATRLAKLRTSNGARVVFDSNFRARGWDDAQQARTAMDPFLAITDIALVTLEDEIALGACTDAASCASRLASLGVEEIVVKDGANGAWVVETGHLARVPARPVEPVDTTAAGDSFNGAYVAARVAGESMAVAARIANTVAGRVVQFSGAIVPASELSVVPT